MLIDNEAQNAVEIFWQLAGDFEPFPRNLTRSVAIALPVSIVSLPRLRIASIESWLKSRQIVYSSGVDDRRLHGCLIAYGGQGMVFVDGSSSDADRRFTIAHEIGHYLVDYWLPRQKAIDSQGSGIVEVLDGIRQPTLREQLHALISGRSITIYTDLLERRDAPQHVWTGEDKADQIALALLAPASEVLDVSGLAELRYDLRRETLGYRLQTIFGLPPSVAEDYCRALLQHVGMGPSWSEMLRH